MGAKEVHQGEECLRRVVFPEGFQRFPEIVSVSTPQVGDERRAEGVVHHAVQLVAKQIAPPLGVGDLGGGVLPDLAQKEAVRGGFLHSGTNFGNKVIRQLIGYVQPPTGGPGPEPVTHHGVLSPDDEVPVVRLVLLNGRQRHDPPPGVIIRRPGMEGKPVEIRGIGALGRAYAGIEAVGVEVAALRAGVVEYTV